jgi:hypothetical protein
MLKQNEAVQEDTIDLFGSSLNLAPESTVDAILRVRVCAHMAAAALSAQDSHPHSFYRSLMLNPRSLHESLFPTMPEDVLKMAQGNAVNCFKMLFL